MGVSLSILLAFPKAQRQNLVWIGIGYENNLIHEAGLTLQYWQNLFLNGFAELPGFSLFGFDRYDSTEHSVPPIGNCLVRKRLCSMASRVKCRKMVQQIKAEGNRNPAKIAISLIDRANA